MTTIECKKLKEQIEKIINKYDDILEDTCGECDGCEVCDYEKMYSYTTLKKLLDAYKKDTRDLVYYIFKEDLKKVSE